MAIMESILNKLSEAKHCNSQVVKPGCGRGRRTATPQQAGVTP